MRWIKTDLFDFGEVVLRVPVQNEFSNGDQRVLSVRPYLGVVERVEVALGGLLG